MRDMPENLWVANPAIGHGFTMTTSYSEEKKYITKYTRSDLTGLQCFYDYEGGLPKQFVAIFGDGSGANLFWERVKGRYMSPGADQFEGMVDKDWFIDAGYLWFIALPDDFKVWGEEAQKENI